jgi:DNA topoisomerase-6 subunit B
MCIRDRVKRKKTFEKYVPEIARALSILTGEPEERIREYFVTFIERHFAEKTVESTAVVEEVAENA